MKVPLTPTRGILSFASLHTKCNINGTPIDVPSQFDHNKEALLARQRKKKMMIGLIGSLSEWVWLRSRGEIRASTPLRTIHLNSRPIKLLRAGTKHSRASTVVHAEIEVYVNVCAESPCQLTVLPNFQFPNANDHSQGVSPKENHQETGKGKGELTDWVGTKRVSSIRA